MPTHFSLTRILVFTLPILFTLLLCAHGQTDTGDMKGISRIIDPITLTGKDLSRLLGRPIKSLRMVSLKHDEIIPIPFQIDEKDQDGNYIFRTSDPQLEDSDHGLMDENDEISFMAMDLGKSLPAGAEIRKDLITAIEVTDPVDRGRGWCYITTEEIVPQTSSIDYVSYDPQEDLIRTRNFRIGFSPEAPISYRDTTITPEGGGNNTRINERVLTRISTRFLRVFHVSRSEEDFRSACKGYIDGQIRIIKRVGNSMRQVFGKYGPEVVVNYTFYHSNWIMPNIIDLPVDVGKFVSSLSLRGGTDWTHEAQGMTFYTKYIPPGIAVIDGHMTEEEKNMDLRLDIEHIWHLYTGALTGAGQGSLLYRILMDDYLQKTLQVRTNYYDKFNDPDHEEDPVSEDNYKRFFEGSYQWTGMEKLPKGRYYLTSHAFIMPDYSNPGDEQKYMDILDKPLQVQSFSP